MRVVEVDETRIHKNVHGCIGKSLEDAFSEQWRLSNRSIMMILERGKDVGSSERLIDLRD